MVRNTLDIPMSHELANTMFYVLEIKTKDNKLLHYQIFERTDTKGNKEESFENQLVRIVKNCEQVLLSKNIPGLQVVIKCTQRKEFL